MDQGEIYIADTNPHNLTPPPLWWQQGLWAFDADLRILPGRKKAVHWLARVKKYSRGLTGDAIIDDQNDTAMFVRYGLVPVTWIASLDGWTEGFLQHIVGELMARDTWAVEGGPLTEDGMRKAMFEGGSKFGKALDAKDDAERQKINAEVRENVYHTTGEAWRLKQALDGERVLSAGMPQALHVPCGEASTEVAVMCIGDDAMVPLDSMEPVQYHPPRRAVPNVADSPTSDGPTV